MIDEKKLIEELENLKTKTLIFKSYLTFDNAIDTAIDTVKKQSKVNEWIPVEKRLPEKDGKYLVYYSCEIDGSVGEDKECGYSVEYFDTENQSFGYYQKIFNPDTLGFVEEEFVEMETAIAWMLLPEPYRGDKNE